MIGGVILAVAAAGAAGCGGEDVASASEGSAVVRAADPEALRPRETANPELSEAERALLLRARGRNWRAVSAAELESFLFGDDRDASVLYVWDEREGGAGLRAFQRAVEGLAPGSVSAAALLLTEEASDDALVSLRSSQLPYPAYHAPPATAVRGRGLTSGSVLVGGEVLGGEAVGEGGRQLTLAELARLGEN